MRYGFDELVIRTGTNCAKWDACEEVFGTADLLPLWVADMDFLCPPQVTEAIVSRAQQGIYGYTRVDPSVTRALVEWVERRYHWRIEPQWVVYTPGVIPGLNFALQAFTRPGDKVIIQPPVYPPFFHSLINNGCQVSENRLRLEAGQYRIDFDDLTARFDDCTSMLVLCSPHNPVGRVWRPDELARMGELCLSHGALIVSDEIHADIILGESKHVPVASLSESLAQSTVTLISPAKTFNLPGLKTSVAIIPNPLLRRRFSQAADRSGIHGVNLFGLVALEAAYRYGEDWLNELLAYLKGNLDYLEGYLKDRVPSIKLVRPEGTFLAWLDCRELGMGDADLKRFMIDRAKVGLNDGAAFGSGGEGFQRLNFGCHRSTLEAALCRLEAAVHGLQLRPGEARRAL